MKKKILWLCNTMLPDLFRRFCTRNVKEGWLVGISNELKKQEGFELHYMCPQDKDRRVVNLEINGVFFHCFYAKYKNMYSINDELRKQIKKIVCEVQPDIIHIFGTEMPHAAACVQCIGRAEKIIVSIQGLVSEYAKHYLDGIPRSTYRSGTFAGRKYKTLLGEYREFCKRVENEINVLKSVKYVIGRTNWDKACVERINNKCTYYHCNETLRESFYNGCWSIDNIERYSIYISQGEYPIKGLHNLIKSLPYVIQRFPAAKVYIAGSDSFLNQGNPYGQYIKKLIKNKKLDKHIIFTGLLSEMQVCKYLQQAHITVMTSNIENSPNSIGEAMLIGTPVVAAYVGGIPDILQHGIEGLLYQPNSETMLSYYICRIFEDRVFAEYLSLNAKKRANQLYNRKENLQSLLQIYDNVGRDVK